MRRTLIATLVMIAALVAGSVSVSARQKKEDEPLCKEVTLTLADVIDLLADFQVRHVEPIPGVPYYGLTHYDSRQIVIFGTGDRPETRDTVIHELLHARYHVERCPASEGQVSEQAGRIYRELFLSSPRP